MPTKVTTTVTSPDSPKAASSTKRVVASPQRRKRPWRLTPRTINIVRLCASILLVILFGYLAIRITSVIHGFNAISSTSQDSTSTASFAKDAASSAKAAAAEAKKVANSASSELASFMRMYKQDIQRIEEKIDGLPDKSNKTLAEAITAVNAKTEAEAIETRKSIDSKATASQQKADEVISKLTASEQVIADMKKSSQEQLVAVKASAPQQPPPAYAPTGRATADLRSETSFNQGLPPPSSQGTAVGSASVETMDRNSAYFPTGGRSKTFSRWDAENLNIVLAPVPGIHATLIYKSGIIRTWTRQVEVIPNQQFEMRGADQVVFWSDNPFWITWKRQ